MDIDVGMSELIVFVYTLGVLFTGLWVADPTWPAFTPYRIGLLFIVALVWTAYASFTVIPRVVDAETEDDDDEDVPPRETAESGY